MQPPKLITLEQANWLAINSPEHQGTGDSKCYNSWPASEQTPPRCNFQDKDLIPELHQQRRYLEDLTTHSDQRLPYSPVPTRPCENRPRLVYLSRTTTSTAQIHGSIYQLAEDAWRSCRVSGGQDDTICIIWRALQWTNLTATIVTMHHHFKWLLSLWCFKSYSGCDERARGPLMHPPVASFVDVFARPTRETVIDISLTNAWQQFLFAWDLRAHEI